MLLRLSPSPVGRPSRNVPYTPGRDFRLDYAVELFAADYPIGTTIVSALLVAEASFGLAPLVTKAITTVASANGQITDDAADGVGALFFALAPGETTALATAPVGFEVIVVDSLGRQATLDLGSLVPTPSTAGNPVDHVVVSPIAFSVQDPGTEQLTVTAYDAEGNVVTGRVINWTSSDPATATVDPTSGLVRGIGAGSVLFTASVEGKSDTSTGTFITNVTVVAVAPNPATTPALETVPLTATPRDAGGTPVPNQTIDWASSDPTIASVDQAGLVTGVAIGSCTITATIHGAIMSGNATVNITQARDGSIADVEHQAVVAGVNLHFWDDADEGNIITASGHVTSHNDARGIGVGRHTLTGRSNNGGAKPTHDSAAHTTAFDPSAQQFEDTDVSADFKLDGDMVYVHAGRVPTSIVDTNFGGVSSGLADGTRRLSLAVLSSKISVLTDTGNLNGDVSSSDTQERLSLGIQLAPPNTTDPNDPTHNFDATAQSAKLCVETIGGVRQYSDVSPSTAGNTKVNFGGIEQFGQFGGITRKFGAAVKGKVPKNLIDAWIRRAQVRGMTFPATPNLITGLGDSTMAGFGTTNPATKTYLALLGINDATPLGYSWINYGIAGRWMRTVDTLAEAWVGAQKHMLRAKMIVLWQMVVNDIQHDTSATANSLLALATHMATVFTQAGILVFPSTLSAFPGAPSWVHDTYNPGIRALKTSNLATDILDFESIAELQDPTNATYIYDPAPGGTGLHPNDAGHLLEYQRQVQPKVVPHL